MKQAISNKINENLERVNNLVAIYESRRTGQGRRSSHQTDILRASVVLLHASMEDLLRSLARWKLPLTNNKELLDTFPFVGTGNRSQKVSLGYLINYKSKSGNDIITDSINDYLERSNYNNTMQLSSLIESLNLDVSKVTRYFPILDEMMKRRHLVVHRADRDDTARGSGNHQIKSIGTGQVRNWIKAVQEFSNELLKQV